MEEKNYCKDDELLCIRFIGDKYLGGDSAIPMYELGQIFISFQQILFKAYVYEKEKPLTNKIKEELSLKMTSRREGSDLYGFKAFLGTPSIQIIIGPLIEKAINAIIEYASGHLKNMLDQRQSPEKFIASIFPQLNNIANRIKSIGGIAKMEFSIPNGASVSINTEAKNEMKQEIRGKTFYGEEQEIKGYVTRLNTTNYDVVVEVDRIGKIKTFVSRVDFEKIRFQTKRDTEITFTGKPKLQFGKESFFKFEEFEAHSISY